MLAAAAVLVLSGASVASAHDELVESTPTSGERLEAAPTEITLSFSADVLAESGTATVLVVDADGTDWAAGEPVVDGPVVTVPLEAGMPDAGYEVRWRVVSSDGHPIAGVIPFTVGDGQPLPTTDSSPSESAAPVEPEPGDGSLTRTLTIAGIGAILAAGVFAAVVLRRRGRSGRNS